MEHVLDIQHLTKTYGKKIALVDISFKVKAGSCFGLLGPNGAGKSTTMKILTGIVEPDTGKVLIQGIDAKKNPVGRREFGPVARE